MRSLVLCPWGSMGLLQRPGSGRGQEQTYCSAVSPNAQILPTLAFVLTSKSEGRKEEGRKNLNKECFQKSSWWKINRSNLKAAQQTPPNDPTHYLDFEITGRHIYVTWPLRWIGAGPLPQHGWGFWGRNGPYRGSQGMLEVPEESELRISYLPASFPPWKTEKQGVGVHVPNSHDPSVFPPLCAFLSGKLVHATPSSWMSPDLLRMSPRIWMPPWSLLLAYIQAALEITW